MKICYIIGAGNLPLLYIKKQNSFVIAADGGYAKLGEITPDVIVGDFDSLGFVPKTPNTITLPVKKDVTDMKYATEIGIQNGYNTFIIYGGTGGREDHTFANYTLLCDLASKGLRGYLIGHNSVTTAISNTAVNLPKHKEGTVSVFSASDISKGVSIKGLEYTLEDEELTFNHPLGVSNSFIGTDNEISVKSGTLLIMWQEKCVKDFIDNL